MKRILVLLVATAFLATGCAAQYIKNVVMEDDAPLTSTEPLELSSGGTLPTTYMESDFEYLGFCSEDSLMGVGESTGLAGGIVCVDASTLEISVASAVSGGYIGDHTNDGKIILSTPTGDDTEIGYTDILSGEYTKIATEERTSIEVQPHWTDDLKSVIYVIKEEENRTIKVYDTEKDALFSQALSEILPVEWMDTLEEVSAINCHSYSKDGFVLSLKYEQKPYIIVKPEGDPYIMMTASDTDEIVMAGKNIYHITQYKDLVKYSLEENVSYKIASAVEDFSITCDEEVLVYQTLNENGCSLLYLVDNNTDKSGLADVRDGVMDFEVSPEGNKLYVKYADESSFETVVKNVVRVF